MASCDDNPEFTDEKPTVSPLLSKYLVISWAMMIEWTLDSVMKNFEVTEFRLKNKKVVSDRFPDGAMKLAKFDNFIVEHMLENNCRVWFKAIGDLTDVNDDCAGCLCRGQKGYLCIQISNKMVEHKVVAYLGHQRYCVRIKKAYPW